MLECSLTKYEEQNVVEWQGGCTILSHEDGREAELDKYDYHMFSGDEIIHSKGLATDYELIFKNGNKGEFRLIDAASTCWKRISSSGILPSPKSPFASIPEAGVTIS